MTNVEGISKVMKEQALWCVWKFDTKRGKIPYSPKTKLPAKTNDITTFVDFETAVKFYQEGNFDGLGMGIFNGFCAIDIDNCIQNGHASEMATKIWEEMKSYTEISPSGNGIHIIFRTEDFKYDKTKYRIMNNQLGLEIYVSGATNKYVTITGDTIPSYDTVVMADEALQRVLDQYMVRTSATGNIVLPYKVEPSTDFFHIGLKKDNILKKYWGGYRDPKRTESQNDFIFIQNLMDCCNNDPNLVLQLFLQSPYAAQKDEEHTKKMMRKDYLPRTIQSVISNRTAAAYFGNLNGPQTIAKSSFISAAQLQEMEFPPVQYLIEDILPEGTSILAAAPKIGKSWFALDMGLCIAMGQPFLGKETHPASVLYLGMEDGYSRLQGRINQLTSEAPSNFYLHTEAPTLDNGFIDFLKDAIEQINPKLIIIDTLQTVRSQMDSGKSSYQKDYQEMRALKNFADANKVSIFLVHHTRKQKDDDPYNMISGTNGIMGAADTIFVMTKAKRSDENATLSVTGRDIEQNDYIIHFDKQSCHWKLIGSQVEVSAQEEKNQYQNNPLVSTIKKLLKNSPDQKWVGTASNLITVGKRLGYTLPQTPQQVGRELKKLKPLLYQYDFILYEALPNGNAGKRHSFQYHNYSPDSSATDKN